MRTKLRAAAPVIALLAIVAVLPAPAVSAASAAPAAPAALSEAASRGLEFAPDGSVHPGRSVAPPSAAVQEAARQHGIDNPGPAVVTPLSRPYGGEYINTNYGSCTNGINTRSSSGQTYATLSGHCTNGSGNLNQWKYPWGSSSTFATLAVRRYDASGDRAYLRSLVPLQRKVQSSCCVYTLTAAGDPVLGETVSIPLGHSGRTWTGYVDRIDQRTLYADGTWHGNQARVYYPVTPTQDCPIGGDSGSPALVGTDAVGHLNSGGATGNTCYLYIEQEEYVLTSQSLILAPA